MATRAGAGLHVEPIVTGHAQVTIGSTQRRGISAAHMRCLGCGASSRVNSTMNHGMTLAGLVGKEIQ